MIHSVLYRDRQEVQAADLNRSQEFVDASFQALILDAITAERMFTGLTVTMKSAMELAVAPGRLWVGDQGRIYEKAQAEVLSVLSYLPVQDTRWLCLSVLGQDEETDVQPRDFLIDLQSGQTEPRAVAMETARVAVLHVTAGLESSDPQKPVAPTGYTTVAMALLNPSGIVEVQQAENRRLMRLFETWQGMRANTAWIAEASPKLSSLMSDMASLAAAVRAQQVAGLVTGLAAEIALIRDRLQLPATYAEYEADNFLDKLKSDTADPGFRALVMMGVRFPWDGQTEQQLSLFNPYDTAVRNFEGLLLPAHGLAARLKLSGMSGELPLSQYQYQTVTTRELTRVRRRTIYSPTMRWCTNGAYWGAQDAGRVIEDVFEGEVPAGVTLGDSRYHEDVFLGGEPGHLIYDSSDVWVHTWEEHYWVTDSQVHSINGSVNAQTFLNSQNGWLRKVGLTFTRKAAEGAVTLLVTDTLNGLPNLERVLGRAVVNPADIRINPEETLFEFPQPVFLSPGRRYALVIVTGGAHHVALVAGTQYSQGTLFYSTDGEYFQGDFTKDLMMSLYYAAFTNPRTVVDLEPVSLAGGIAAFDVLHEIIQPDATSLVLEYQPAGSSEWLPIQPGSTQGLLGLPAMCRLRAVFNGSGDIMPCLGLAGSKFRASRPAQTFRHVSAARVLTKASDEVEVILRLEGWDQARHTCAVKLLVGEAVHDGAVTDVDLGNDTIRRTVRFTPPATSTYRIRIDGTTDTPLKCYHVAQRMDVAQ